MSKVVELRWSIQSDFHCPACGTKIIDVGSRKFNRCSHVLFAYTDVAEGYDIHPDRDFWGNFSKEYAKIYGEDPHPHCFDLEAAKQALPENSIIFELSDWGIACGPVGATTYIGLRFED